MQASLTAVIIRDRPTCAIAAPMAHPSPSHPHPLPAGLEVQRGHQRLRLWRRWLTPAVYVMGGWAIVWFAVTHFLLSLGGHPPTLVNLYVALPGLFMTYAALTRVLNQTLIEVTPTQLVVQHRPLPWALGKRLATQDIQGVYGDFKVVYAKQGRVDVQRVMVVRANGRKTVLLSGIELTELQRDFIVAELCDYLQSLSAPAP